MFISHKKKREYAKTPRKSRNYKNIMFTSLEDRQSGRQNNLQTIFSQLRYGMIDGRTDKVNYRIALLLKSYVCLMLHN